MDITKAKGLWLLPSRRRLRNLNRFFDSCHTIGVHSAGLVLVESGELEELRAEYDRLILPPGWEIVGLPGCDMQGDKIRAVWDRIKDLDWVGLMGDDCVPSTPNWDTLMVSGLQRWNFVSCNDGWQAPKRVGNCWAVSGDLYRAVGYFWPERLNHLFIDDVWETIGRETGCWQVRMDIMVRHAHVFVTKESEDETHKRAYNDDNWAHDHSVWDDWQINEMPRCIQAVEALKTDLGVFKASVDLKGISIMVGTPCVSNKFVTEYVGSLYSTMLMLGQQGVPYTWVVEGGNADVVSARAELFAHFLESSYSHLFLIDDDMGWDPQALSRLLYAKKDYVAVAGRKKRDVPQYALNPFDTTDKVVEVPVDVATGTAEVKEVGMAFCLITRACVEKMVAAYGKELRYVLPGGEVRYSLCMPLMTENGAYKAEDYAFCHRWRAIGGGVYVCPDVSLKHVGGKVYEGAWSDLWEAERVPMTVLAEQAAE